MSGINVECDIPKYENVRTEANIDHPDFNRNFSTLIASEIVSDIIDTALDIAIGKPDIVWDQSITRAEPLVDEYCLTKKVNSPVLPPKIKNFINSISTNQNNNMEEPARLDIEMKKLLTEMISPPYPIINYESLPRQDGVGDQPPRVLNEEIKLDETKSEDIFVDPESIRVVEKKSRVTDLMKNSKQVLKEYFMDEAAKQEYSDWEEKNERVLDVIELDCVTADDHRFQSQSKTPLQIDNTSKIRPEEVPLPEDDINLSKTPSKLEFEDEERLVQVITHPDDENVDSIPSEEKPISKCGKGDEVGEVEREEARVVTNKAGIDNDSVKEVTAGKSKNKKKKKWNLGNRIMEFIRRKPKNREECSVSQE